MVESPTQPPLEQGEECIAAHRFHSPRCHSRESGNLCFPAPHTTEIPASAGTTRWVVGGNRGSGAHPQNLCNLSTLFVPTTARRLAVVKIYSVANALVALSALRRARVVAWMAS